MSRARTFRLRVGESRRWGRDRYFGNDGSEGAEHAGAIRDGSGRRGKYRHPHKSGNNTLLPHVTGGHRELGEAHVFEDIMQLVDWVTDGTPSVATAEHARHVIEIFEAGYRAAETGQTQDLTTTF